VAIKALLGGSALDCNRAQMLTGIGALFGTPKGLHGRLRLCAEVANYAPRPLAAPFAGCRREARAVCSATSPTRGRA
jgi:hypothetical protein